MSEANQENEARRTSFFFFFGEFFKSKEMIHFPPVNNCLLFASSFFWSVFLYLMLYFIVWRNGSIEVIASVSLTVHYRCVRAPKPSLGTRYNSNFYGK